MNNEPKQSHQGRILRLLLLCLGVLATLVVGFYTVENWRGWHAWDGYARVHASRGEKLDLVLMVPPPVPDDQNFCLCPLLKPVLDAEKVNGTLVWHDTNGLARLQALRPWLDLKAPPIPITNGLVGWQAYYRSLAGTNSPDTLSPAFRQRYGLPAPGPTLANLAELHLTNSPAVDVLLVLGRCDPALAELKREAALRPQDRWAINYDTNSPLGIMLPHLAQIKGLCSLLQLRELAEVGTGDQVGALSDLQLAGRLADSVRTEPIMISQIVRFVCWELILPPMREGLRSHRLSEAQLSDLERQLLAVDLLTGYKLSVTGERVANWAWATLTRKECDQLSQGMPPEAIRPFYAIARFGSLAPRGWMYQNRLVLCRLSEDYLEPVVDITNHTVPPARTRALADAFQEAKGPYSAMVPWIFELQAQFGNMYFRGHTLAHAQTEINQAAIACALERYRLVHKEYPETLDALAPQFIPQVPHDLIDGRPLHFRRNPEGTYLLYSVGWNEVDDGGTTVSKDDSQVDLKQGDWVW